jgi:NAD(P)-dependent dehydrogenase (short-subunit alcohol dehydrogenase family)
MSQPRGAVVVGGGSGIGAAVVAEYRSRGGTPVVWDIAGDFDVSCDVSDPQSVEAALSETLERVGVPNQLTITAGVGHGALLLDESVEEFDRMMAINTRGPWLVTRAVAREMIASDVAGSMVVTSSVSAHLVDRAMGTYCASKSALSMLVRVAACERAPYGIRVNAIGPGVTETPTLGATPGRASWLASVTSRTPLHRIGQATDISQGIMALHSLEWVTGQVLDCDGGLSLHSPIDSYGESRRVRSSGGL